MKHLDTVFTHVHCEYPIEQLFKAIFMMEEIAELDKETERLKKKLHKYLMKATTEKEGKRLYADGEVIQYFPNGLCKYHFGSNNGRCIFLEGYTSTYVAPEPEPVIVEESKRKYPTEQRKHAPRKYPAERALTSYDYRTGCVHPIWYAQVKEYLQKKKYELPVDKKIEAFEEAYRKKQMYEQLDVTEKQLLQTSHNFLMKIVGHSQAIYDLFQNHFKESRYSCYRYNVNHPKEQTYQAITTFPFLLEDEIIELLALCDEAYLAYKKPVHWGSPKTIIEQLAKPLEQFKEKILSNLNREGRVVLNLEKAFTTVTHYSPYMDKITDLKGKNVERKGYSARYDVEPYNIFEVLLEQIAEIEDPTIIKILTKFGLYLPHLFPVKEEQPEEEVVV